MHKAIINPWKWQDRYHYIQAVDITEAKRTIHCSGQVSVDDQGVPINKNSMSAQIDKCFDNLETVLDQAGAKLSDVVRLTYYTTSISEFSKAGRIVNKRLIDGKCKTTSTLLGVNELFHPDILVEIEATAIK